MKNFKLERNHILVAVLLIVALLFPQVVDRPYIMAIAVLTLYYACGALAYSIVGGILGQVAMGYAAFGALGSYIGAVAFMKFDISPWIAMIIAFFVVGTIMMLLITPCFGLTGVYFSLATIAFGEAFKNIFTNWQYVGGGQGMLLSLVKKDSLWMLAFKNKGSYFYVALALLIVFYIVVKLIDTSKFGYGLKTIREDEGTAMAIGINPLVYKMAAVFVSCGMIGIMGVFYACYVRYVAPDLMAQGATIELVIPAVVGGLYTVEGPILGALIVVPLAQLLNANLGSVLPGLNLIVYSLVLIIVILFQPAGIMGWYKAKKQNQKISAQRKEMEG